MPLHIAELWLKNGKYMKEKENCESDRCVISDVSKIS